MSIRLKAVFITVFLSLLLALIFSGEGLQEREPTLTAQTDPARREDNGKSRFIASRPTAKLQRPLGETSVFVLSSDRRTSSPPAVQDNLEIAITGNDSIASKILKELLKRPQGANLEEWRIAIHNRVGELYRSLGFVQVEIVDLQIEDNDPPLVEMEIREGDIFHIAAQEFVDFRDSVASQLEEFFPAAGDVADYSALKRGYSELKSRYRDRGFLDFQVIPEISADRSSHVLEIRHQINEGPRYVIREISAPPGFSLPIGAGEPFHLGLLRAYLESAGFSASNLSFERVPGQAAVDVEIRP